MKIQEAAFKVSKGKNTNNKNIAYIDPSLPENTDSFYHKEIFKKYGAKWDGINKVWFWYIGETQPQWENVYRRFIEPALKEAHAAQNATENESKTSLIASIDNILGTVISSPTSTTDPNLPTDQDKKLVIDRLKKFKEELMAIEDDEEFKNTLMIIRNFKNSQGHRYSFNNSLLIWIQNPNATMVKSKYNWNKSNREVNEDAKKIFIWSPNPRKLMPYSQQEKTDITNKFLQNLNKKRVEELSVGEKEKLGILLRGKFIRSGALDDFELSVAYDIKDTTQIEGKDVLIDPDKIKNIDDVKWAEEDMIDDKVKPVYDGLMEFARSKHIDIEMTDTLGGAKGVSMGGKIKLLNNKGNDVGLTKTLAHEIAHELLHQSYARSKDKEVEQFFIGQQEGRETVEQQAELTAWIVMAEFGFNLKTTSINYITLWGADKTKMLTVFDTIANVANYLIAYLDKYMENNRIYEIKLNETTSKLSALDVAKFIGLENMYLNQLKTEKQKQLNEKFYKLVGSKL